MMLVEPVTLTDPVAVEAALLDRRLVPPPNTLSPGATSDLRQAMARFSGPKAHADRRADVNRAVASVTQHRLTADARRRTSELIAAIGDKRSVEAAADIGFVVPVETVAAALDVTEQHLGAVRADVAAIVAVIGRGAPSSPQSDDAAIRLAGHFYAGHQNAVDPNAVAKVSLLYQTFDSTAALFASTLLAHQTETRRRPAIAATARTATAAVTIGSVHIEPGAAVVIDLESPRFEFGLGPHGCPGREIAERIVAGMLDAIRCAGLELDIATVGRREDGRLKTLPLIVRD